MYFETKHWRLQSSGELPGERRREMADTERFGQTVADDRPVAVRGAAEQRHSQRHVVRKPLRNNAKTCLRKDPEALEPRGRRRSLLPFQYTRRESNTPTETLRIMGMAEQGGAESGALDPELAEIVSAWEQMPAAIRAGILALVKAADE